MKSLEVSGLTKTYGPLTAVKDLSLSVSQGEIFGLLGHNGAGKTTTIECVLGTKKPDRERSGSLVGIRGPRGRPLPKVGASSRPRNQDKIRYGRPANQRPVYTGNRDYDSSRKVRPGRIPEKQVSELSGGERQKLSIILALIPKPRIPLSRRTHHGARPQSPQEMWRYLTGLKGRASPSSSPRTTWTRLNSSAQDHDLKNGCAVAQGLRKN
jgi:ABC-2 type transport system ATP-binding protein